jgi:hypothetical protein
MVSGKSLLFIEAMGFGAPIIRHELHHATAALARAIDCPGEERFANAVATNPSCDPDCFNVSPPHAFAGKTWNKGHLQACDNLTLKFGDSEKLVGIAIYAPERVAVGFGVSRFVELLQIIIHQ